MSSHAARLLEDRAIALAARPSGDSDDLGAEAIVVAALGKDRIGVPLMAAREVVPYIGAARIPGAPAWLRGLIQLRGELLCVLDLLSWWRPGQSCAGKHLIVVEGKVGPMAILADAIIEVREVSSRDLADALQGEVLQAHPGLRSITRDLVYVLEVERMLQHPALSLAQAAGPTAALGAGEHE